MAISDASVAGLDETVSLLAGRGADAQRAEFDVSDRFAVGEYAPVIAEHFGVMHQLNDNAGIAFSRSALETVDGFRPRSCSMYRSHSAAASANVAPVRTIPGSEPRRA